MAGGYKFIMGKQTAVRCCSSIGVEDDHDSRSSGWSVAVGPKMTREANTGKEGSPTLWANVGGDTRALRATCFCCASAGHRFSATWTYEYFDFAMLGCVVGSELLPIANIDVQVLEASFDVVFIACSEVIHS